MIEEYKDFIGIYKNVYSDGFCKHLISEIDRLQSYGAGFTRQESENIPHHLKADYSLLLNLMPHSLKQFNDECTFKTMYDGLQNCFNRYVEKYSILKTENLFSSHAKAQKTGPGEGYQLFHQERGGTQFHRDRTLVYILYLNTLNENEGGETEFLYQKTRFRPEENTMLIHPALFTHTHKGNTVLGENYKYIITGWFSYS